MAEYIERKDCPMRHENGNCTVAGGFCTAVNDPICEALHNAFDCGVRSQIEWVTLTLAEQSTRFAQKQLAVLQEIRDKHSTADVAPVVHGRWEFKHPNGWACSNCGEWGLMIDNRGICKSNYCPNCGAKMDKEESDNA